MRLYPILARGLARLALWWMQRPRQRREGWATDLADRRGLWAPAVERPLWVHAASVGEVQSARGLLAVIHQRWPAQALLLTAFTPSGLAQWRRYAPTGAAVHALPLDHPHWVAQAIASVQPAAVLIVETELWPNWLLALHRAAVPVMFVSARLRPTSVRGWQRWIGPELLRQALAPVHLVAAQTAADADRFVALGARQVEAQGSLKWDQSALDLTASVQAPLRQSMAQRPVWAAVSTHEGEERAVLEAHRELRRRWPDLLLILIPRHPRRAPSVAELCQSFDLGVTLRSAAKVPGSAAVWLIDTLGEATAFMAVAPVCFMGGSLVPIGGHNLLEPAELGCAIHVGPHTQNAADVAQSLEAAQALVRVADAAELAQSIARDLADPALAATRAERARQVRAAGRGAQQRALDSVGRLLAVAQAGATPPR